MVSVDSDMRFFFFFFGSRALDLEKVLTSTLQFILKGQKGSNL